MDRARVIETLFRNGKGGREPLAPPGEGGSHVHYTSSGLGIGCKTSRPPGATTDEEWMALRHGLTVIQLRELLRESANGG